MHNFDIQAGIIKAYLGANWSDSRDMLKGFSKKKKLQQKRDQTDDYSEQPGPVVTNQLDQNITYLKERIGHSEDVIFRPFYIEDKTQRATLLYVEGMVDKTVLHHQLLESLMKTRKVDLDPFSQHEKIEFLMSQMISVGQVKRIKCLEESVSEVLKGNTLLLVDGIEAAISVGTVGYESRTVDEPITESVVRGPREGFVENMNVNSTLIRRRLKNPDLTFRNFEIGARTHKKIGVVSIRGLTNPEILNDIISRIERINIDDVPESGVVEQLIEDNPFSVFPQIQNTERVDRVVGALLEGRVVILIEGSPFALIAPVTFSMFMSSPEDYYERWIPTSLVRMLRYGSLFIALFLPSLYISLISYNQGLLPTRLVISIAASREGVPFPSIVEALIMEVSIEILREAGLRLPQPIGQAVGIVGGLVIGQAAVEAGIVSPIMVIVVALTAISSFVFPQYGAGIAVRILRFFMMISAAVLGLYGIILAFILVTAHMVKLKSFGVDYLTPFAPIRIQSWKDLFVRFPIYSLGQRPEMIKPLDKIRHSMKPKGK